MVNSLNETQAVMLDMLKWFHSFCEKQHISYYIVGGTMLGAIRHKGFIPWDDDIDVGIPRKDFDRLINNKNAFLKGEERYTIESFLDGNKDFEYPYAKVYDTYTTLVENCRQKTKRGVYIDVFPLDGIGSDYADSMQNYSPINKQLNFLMTRICEIRKSRSFLKNTAIVLSQLIPDFILSNHKLIMKINNMCSARDFDTTPYVGNLVGNWGKKEIMPRDFFGKPTLYQFEDTEVFGPENYDNYLRNVYNNWQQLPPPEKQKSHHDFLHLDLNKSYKDN